MTDRYNPQHGANMVDRYIGSAFDIVYAVYKQLDSMPVFLEFMEETSLEIEAYHTTILEKYDLIVGMEISILDAKDVVLDAEGSTLGAKDVALQAATDAMEYRDTTQQLINEAEQFKLYLIDVIENSIDPLFVNVGRIREDSWANRETLGGLYTHYVREDDGTPVANAECAVYVENSGVLATGLKDKFGQPLANPFVSDADGLVQFVADPGMYTLEVSFDLVVHTYSVYFADEKVRSDLADPTKGASMVAYQGGTVKSFLESLGTAAAQDVEDFDPSGAAALAQAHAVQRANHTGTQAISTIVDLQTNLDGKAPLFTPVIDYTGTGRDLLLSDEKSFIRASNAADITFTIPQESSVAWKGGTEIYFQQAGLGQVIFAAGAGVTLEVSPAYELKTKELMAVACLKKVGTNLWTLFGLLELAP